MNMLFLVFFFGLALSLDIYISPKRGDDNNDGRSNSYPLKTLNAAFVSLGFDGVPEGGITFYLDGGYYPFINKTIIINSERFNGSSIDKQIKFKAIDGQTPIFTGGVRIGKSLFREVDKTKDYKGYYRIKPEYLNSTFVCDLSALDEDIGFAQMQPTGNMEIYIDDQRMNMARYPNKDYTPEEEKGDSIFVTTSTTSPASPDVTGFYKPYGTNKCADKVIYQSSNQINGNYYYVYFTVNGSWVVSKRKDCLLPIVSDGASWSSKRINIEGDLNPLSGSGASGILKLPMAGIYRGFMFIANAAGTENTLEFTYNDNRVSSWKNAKDMWVHGYFKFLWSDSSVAATVDATNKKVVLASKTSYGVFPGMPWYAYNLLEELDEPGEYYIDREDKKLYLNIPEGTKEIWLSQSTSTMIEISDVKYVSFEGITFEYTANSFINIKSGSNHSIKNCIFKHTGAHAINIRGSYNGIEDSKIYDIGNNAISIYCGERKSITRGECYAINNYIANFSQIRYTYQPAITLGGVGNKASHNVMEGSPHEAVAFSGNHHEISYNLIRDVCQYASDAGAIYSGRRWDWRGNVIKYNYIYNITGFGRMNSYVQGIYLDDCLAGEVVYGNIVQTVRGRCILHGGGRDNIFQNNILYDCDVSYSADARGPKSYNTASGDSWNLLERCSDEEVNRLIEPWKSAYPELYVIPNDNTKIISENHWLLPENCTFKCNVPYNSTKTYSIQTEAQDHVTFIDNFNSSIDPLFVDPENHDLRLQENSPVYDLGCFKDIPFEKIGIYHESVSISVSICLFLSLVLLLL